MTSSSDFTDLSEFVNRIQDLMGVTGVALDGSRPRGQAPLSALAECLVATGLVPFRFVAPPGAVLADLHEARPLVAIDRDEKAVIVLRRAGERVLLEGEGGMREWVTLEQLCLRLGVQHEGVEHEWLALESRTPMPLHHEAEPWRNALALIRSEAGNLGAIVIYAVGVGLLSLALPLAVQSLVNTVAFGQLLQPIVVLTLLLAGGLVFAAVLRALQTWMVEIVQRRLFVRLVSELGHRLPRVPIRAFEAGHGPELINRFFDVFTAQKAVASLLLGGVEALLTTLVGIVVLAFYHPILLAFGLLLLGAAGVVFVALGYGASKTTVAESRAKYAVAGWLEEMARHVFALKMAGGSAYASRRLDALAVDWLRYRAAHFRIFFRQLVGALTLQVVAHASLLGIGGWLVVERELTIGQLVAAELIVTAVVASLSKLGGKLEAVYDLFAAADKLGVLLSIPVEEEVGDQPAGDGGAARIELREVSSKGGELEAFSAVIKEGEKVALRGDRRAATALVELLFGMRLPQRGAVLINDQDIRDVRLSALRERIAVVREPEVMPGTLADNLRSVAHPVSSAQMWSILARVGLADEIRSLPHGLQTPLMPSGAPLDRLAALRLTMARALAARPAVLVLDGSIDALPEEERSPLIQRLGEGRTLVVLTHEHDVARHCDSSVQLPLRAVRQGAA